MATTSGSTLRLSARIPRRLQVAATEAQLKTVSTRLRNFATNVQRRMATYPAQAPTTSGYQRTGDYGRNWRVRVISTYEVSVSNAVNRTSRRASSATRVRHALGRSGGGRAYAVYVGGPKTGDGPGLRQAAEMKRRGWPSITTVSSEEWKKALPGIRSAFSVSA